MYLIYPYIVLTVILLFYNYKTIKLDKVCLIITMSITISILTSGVLLIRSKYTEYHYYIYYILLGIFAASLTDIGAYFGGKYFGNIKLAKNISPNKTIEGAAFGVIFNVIICLIFSFIYQYVLYLQDILIQINIINLIILGIFASISGIIGDLLASIIKRQYDVKDFGSIIPGHGGILDRFDSMLLAMPSIFIGLHFFPVI